MELAVTMPLLVALALGTADYGRVAMAAICVNNAASVGAYYASSSASANQAGIRNAVLQDLQGLGGVVPADVTVTSSTTTDPEGYPSVQVTVSVPFKTLCHFPTDLVTISKTCPMRVRPL